jgi:3-hydroxyisobutyrate dehydrogenase-like beta-hydroxyacid dehydrogenase
METPPKANPVGIIGLGLMGTALADRFLEHGYRVVIWNRTQEKARPLLAKGAKWNENPLVECSRLIVSLYTTEVVTGVLERMQSGLRPGHIIVDTTTGDPAQTEALGKKLEQRGVLYLDAPISGSSEQTRRGEATVIVGGSAEAFQACIDLWQVIGKKTFHVGNCGSATKMKLISNLVLGLNRAALAEGLAFAEALGVSTTAALEIMSSSAAYSRVMDVKGRKMIENDFTAQARLSQHLKDVRLILEAARAAALQLPFSETHRQLLEHAEAAGLGERDNSAIIQVIRKTKAVQTR